MTESELTRLETALSLTLPQQYRRLMSSYPFEDYSRPAEAYVPNNADYILDLNREMRDGEDYRAIWRPHFFAVGTTWGGETFFLDSTLKDSPVYIARQDSLAIQKVAPSFDSWIAQLTHWYVDFNADAVAEEYSTIVSAIEMAGIFSTPPAPMDGWHRICIASQRRRQGGLAGNSFWVAPINGQWFAGTWGGFVYRVLGSVGDFCVAWLTQDPDDLPADFDDDIKEQFQLQSLTEEEFDAITTGANE